jgi:N-acetylneuraminate lyase
MRQQVAEEAIRSSPPGKIVIIHVGASNLADAVQLARHAERTGASAVSSLPPTGSGTFAELRQYYRDLAAATGLPLLVYFFPELCSCIFTLDQILELCEIPGVVGLKFTDFDLYKLQQIQRCGNVIFNGRDEVFAAGMLMGASGGIGSFYNLIPAAFVRVYNGARAGQWEEARRTQEQINEIIRIVLSFPPMAALKAILRWQGFDCGRCLTEPELLAESEQQKLREQLRRTILGEALAGGG